MTNEEDLSTQTTHQSTNNPSPQQLKPSKERLSNEQKKPLDKQEIFYQELQKKMISRNKFVSGHHEEDSEDDSTIITSIPKPKVVSTTESQSQPVVEEIARQAAEETVSQQAEETVSQEQQRLLNDSLKEFYSQEVSNNLAESQYTLTVLARESQQRQQEQRRSLLMPSTQMLPNPARLSVVKD